MPPEDRRKPPVRPPLKMFRGAARGKLTRNAEPDHAAATAARARCRRQRRIDGEERRQILILIKVQRAQSAGHLPEINGDVEFARRQRVPVGRCQCRLERPLCVCDRRHLRAVDAGHEERIRPQQWFNCFEWIHCVRRFVAEFFGGPGSCFQRAFASFRAGRRQG